jgi:hypothetical protein
MQAHDCPFRRPTAKVAARFSRYIECKPRQGCRGEQRHGCHTVEQRLIESLGCPSLHQCGQRFVPQSSSCECAMTNVVALFFCPLRGHVRQAEGLLRRSVLARKTRISCFAKVCAPGADKTGIQPRHGSRGNSDTDVKTQLKNWKETRRCHIPTPRGDVFRPRVLPPRVRHNVTLWRSYFLLAVVVGVTQVFVSFADTCLCKTQTLEQDLSRRWSAHPSTT